MDINTTLLFQVLFFYAIHIIANGLLAKKARQPYVKFAALSLIPVVNWLITLYLVIILASNKSNKSVSSV